MLTTSRAWVTAAVVVALGSGSIARAATSDTEDDTQDEAKTTPKAKASPKHDAAKQESAKQESTSDVKADTSNADDSKAGDAKSSEKLDAKADAKADDDKTDETNNEKPVPVAAKPNRPLSVEVNGWKASVYGFAELDFMQDSTQSYVEGSGNTTLARPNTLPGDNPRSQMTARNSRIGFVAGAPEMGGIKASSVMEIDFFGNQPVEATQNDFYTNGPLRMRLFYLKLETPIVDVIAGQYHDLFAWGSFGFYPNTDAYLPLLGEVYHRNPQLRLTKTLHAGAVDLQIAVAAVRPAGRDSGYPDGQGGVRLAVLPWEGANTQGAGRPIVAPMALGISGIVRRLSVNDFSATPSNPQTATAWGVAGNLFLPIIPARGQDMSNAISITLEGTMGTGISDLYTGLTGGVGFPQLPNPNMNVAVPTYIPNIDPGIATFDGSSVLQTVNWRTFVGNLQYHLPIADGKKVWVSGTYSLIRSTNVAQLIPEAGRPFAWNKGQYADGNLWIALTQAVQLGVSAQWTQQTFLDSVNGANLRGEGSLIMFF